MFIKIFTLFFIWNKLLLKNQIRIVTGVSRIKRFCNEKNYSENLVFEKIEGVSSIDLSAGKFQKEMIV